MKKVWIIILGIIDILAFGSLLVLYSYGFILRWGLADAFTWGLPVFIALLLTLFFGISSLKMRNWKWALTGIIIAVAGWLYGFCISFYLSF